MIDDQLTFQENDIAHMVNSAYGLVRGGDFAGAISLLERSLELDVEYAGVTSALKSAHFWNERKQKNQGIINEPAQGDYLLDEWTAFNRFATRIGDLPDRCYNDFKYYVHRAALKCLLNSTAPAEQKFYATANSLQDKTTRNYYLIGHCYKVLGDYSQATAHLEKANGSYENWPPILAELADCYDLLKEHRAAKIFFREAFYIDPQRIEIEAIECTMMLRLSDRVVSLGRKDAELLEWIPVYGVVFGVFNVNSARDVNVF